MKKELSDKQKKWIKRGVILLIIIGLLVGIGSCLNNAKTQLTTGEVADATAERGDIEVAIKGSGTIEPIDKYEVMSLVKGDILSSPFEVGDTVEKGAILYQFDAKEINNNIDKSKLAVEKSKTAQSINIENQKDLNVNSNISGRVTKVYVKKGDNIQPGTKIIDVQSSDNMKIKVPFNTNDAAYISVGESATVNFENSSYTMYGTVSNVESTSYANGYNVSVTNVEISVANPGGIKNGDKATAMVGNIACNSSGVFEAIDEISVVSKSSGEIASLNYKEGDRVTQGSVVASLKNKNLEDSIKQGELTIKDSQLGLDGMNSKLDDYTIKSPIKGTVIEKNMSAGDKLEMSSTTQKPMAVIADLSTIIFKIKIDELDIDKIQVGQSVDITVDALPNATYIGHVDSININGETANGVTSYPVTVVVDNPVGLLPGMNVNANIVVSKITNVIKIPITAVKRGNFVYVKDDSVKNDESKKEEPEATKDATKSQENIPDGYRKVKVSTGANDEDYIEIIDGINEGDVVFISNINKSNAMQEMHKMEEQSMDNSQPPEGKPAGGAKQND